MNNTDQIKLLLSMFTIQLPTLLVCFVAIVVVLGRWKAGSEGSIWALLGFSLAAVLCFAVPVAQTVVIKRVSITAELASASGRSASSR